MVQGGWRNYIPKTSTFVISNDSHDYGLSNHSAGAAGTGFIEARMSHGDAEKDQGFWKPSRLPDEDGGPSWGSGGAGCKGNIGWRRLNAFKSVILHLERSCVKHPDHALVEKEATPVRHDGSTQFSTPMPTSCGVGAGIDDVPMGMDMDMVMVISSPHGNRDSGRRLRRWKFESEVVSRYLAPRVTSGKGGTIATQKSMGAPGDPEIRTSHRFIDPSIHPSDRDTETDGQSGIKLDGKRWIPA